MTKEEFDQKMRDELPDLLNPVVDWLGDNGHPYMYIIINMDRVEVVEGLRTFFPKKSN